tara:strand:+ start:387 stop:1061 length:675 start_codon:yes stop_codon:yes gene_type:complete
MSIKTRLKITDLPWELIVYIDEMILYETIIINVPRPKYESPNRNILMGSIFPGGITYYMYPRYQDTSGNPHTQYVCWEKVLFEKYGPANSINRHGVLRGVALIQKLNVTAQLKSNYCLAKALKFKTSKSKPKYTSICEKYISDLDIYNLDKLKLPPAPHKKWITLNRSSTQDWMLEFNKGDYVMQNQCVALTKKGHRCGNKIPKIKFEFGHTRCQKHSFVFKGL